MVSSVTAMYMQYGGPWTRGR